ncbi:hypothetical protein ACFP3Q_12035 [Nocardioides sp. GCM10027113]|uniref:hypothetical protein n=1 Tax=unclassified Nocardioides TaxID=2615069 RepID=UPI003611B233
MTRRHLRHRTAVVSGLVVGLCLTGCGGGDGTGDTGATADGGETTASEESPPADQAAGDVREGEPTLTADPATAWADVDDGRLDYEAAGSVSHVCDIGPDRIQVGFQTAEGQDLLLQVVRQGDSWTGRLAFQQGGGANLQYSATLPADAAPLVIGEDSLSFEGTVSRVEDFDAAGATRVPAAVAVSCALPGGVPTATVGGTTYSFAPGGAQSFDCSVTDDAIEVRVNRLAVDGLQLELSARREGGDWVGAAVVTTPDATFTSTLPPDGTGLSLDGTAVDYEGTFSSEDEEQPGTVSVTCP